MAKAKDIIITAGLDLSDFESGMNRLATAMVQQHGGIFREVYTEADAASNALRNFGGNILNAAEAIPVLGPAIKQVSDAYAQLLTDYNALGTASNKAAVSQDQLIDKFKEVAEARNTIREHGTHGPALAATEAQSAAAMANITEQFLKNSKAEVAAYDASNIAVKEHVELQKLQIETDAKLAALQNQLRPHGVALGPSGAKILVAAEESIKREVEQREKALKLSIEQQESQRDINEQAAKVDVTYESQLSMLGTINNELSRQYQVAAKLYGEHSLIATALKAQAHEAQLRYQQMVYDHDKEIQNAKLTTEAMDAQLAGNSKLTALAKIRAQYTSQIADAERKGNIALANELKTQQALAILEARAKNNMMTPSERRQERQAQRHFNHAIRIEESRDRVNADAAKRGAYGYRSSRDYRSPATEAAKQRYVQRHSELRVDKLNIDGTMAVATIVAGILTGR